MIQFGIVLLTFLGLVMKADALTVLPPRGDAPPDVLTISPDLSHPVISEGSPAPGRLVLQQLPAYSGTEVYHALWLPEDWTPKRRFPVIVEYLGNSQRVQKGFKGAGMGMGGKRGFIWIVLPFVDVGGRADAAWWWGDVTATIAYAKEAVPALCAAWSGDPSRVILTGHSRGAIACNYIGLHDDEIAKLWRAIVPFSHYDDGHIPWGMTPEEQAKAPERLARLGSIPQYVMGEQSILPQPWGDKELRATLSERKLASFAEARNVLGLKPITEIEGTKEFLKKNFKGNSEKLVVADLPYVNHSSEILLRDIPERKQLRQWLARVLDLPQGER